MTNILEIPQIPVAAIELLQNDLHIGFGGDLSKRIQNARWADDAHSTKVFPDDVDALMAAFIAAQATEDQVYVIAQDSDLTKQRLEKDHQRDSLYKEIRKTVDTFATLSIFPEKQAKALVMQPIMQKYNIQPDGGIEAQTVATDQWLQEQLQNYQLELAAREQTDTAYRELMLMINAQAITSASRSLYTDLIPPIQETIRYYRQISDERRRQNRRVSVKSDIVGNKLYATSNGWTWQRLIDDGKAALAVDETDPSRIVSTDKKALKAGGLMLALAGQPVGPADDIDVDREYELVALPAAQA